MGDLMSVIADFRNRQENYDKHNVTMRFSKIETNPSPKVRIANWNISISNWLRVCFYERL